MRRVRERFPGVPLAGLDLPDEALSDQWQALGLPCLFGDATRLPFPDRVVRPRAGHRGARARARAGGRAGRAGPGVLRHARGVGAVRADLAGRQHRPSALRRGTGATRRATSTTGPAGGSAASSPTASTSPTSAAPSRGRWSGHPAADLIRVFRAGPPRSRHSDGSKHSDGERQRTAPRAIRAASTWSAMAAARISLPASLGWNPSAIRTALPMLSRGSIDVGRPAAVAPGQHVPRVDEHDAGPLGRRRLGRPVLQGQPDDVVGSGWLAVPTQITVRPSAPSRSIISPARCWYSLIHAAALASGSPTTTDPSASTSPTKSLPPNDVIDDVGMDLRQALADPVEPVELVRTGQARCSSVVDLGLDDAGVIEQSRQRRPPQAGEAVPDDEHVGGVLGRRWPARRRLGRRAPSSAAEWPSVCRHGRRRRSSSPPSPRGRTLGCSWPRSPDATVPSRRSSSPAQWRRRPVVVAAEGPRHPHDAEPADHDDGDQRRPTHQVAAAADPATGPGAGRGRLGHRSGHRCRIYGPGSRHHGGRPPRRRRRPAALR